MRRSWRRIDPCPTGPDFVAFSGHKLYAPFGAGALIGPRRVFERGDPFLAGGGAVDLVDLDEVIWTDPPEREEAGSPNVVGAVAFGTAMDELERIGWDAIARPRGRAGDTAVRGACGPSTACACSDRGPSPARPRARARRGDVHRGRDAPRPGGGPAERRSSGSACGTGASARIRTSSACSASAATGWTRRGPPCSAATAAAFPARCGPAAGSAPPTTTSTRCSTRCAPWRPATPAPVPYVQDDVTGDFWPEGDAAGWSATDRPAGAACARG